MRWQVIILSCALLAGCTGQPVWPADPGASTVPVTRQPAQVDEAKAIKIAHDYIWAMPFGVGIADRAKYSTQRVDGGWRVLAWWSPRYPGGRCLIVVADDGKVTSFKWDRDQ